METKTAIKWKYINGLKQEPKELDFHITPVLTFSRAGKELEEYGTAWGICIEWGHWAIGFGVFQVIIKR